MVPTIYLSKTGLDRVAVAQEEFNRHVTLSASGRCRSCGSEGPCACQLRAVRVLVGYGQLPRRTPGATRPEQIGQATSGAWFTASGADPR